MAARKTNRRSPRVHVHSLVVRYDFDRGMWVHSAGIVITPREIAVLEALANGHNPMNMAAGASMSVATFYACQTRLKQCFGITARSAAGQRELIKIAMDLFGVRAETRCSDG
jgi:hypothetical protein